MLSLIVSVLYSFQHLMQKNFHCTFSFPLWLLTPCESSRKGGIFSVLQIKETGNKGFAYKCQQMLLSSSAHLTCTLQPLQFRLCIDPWWPRPIKANRQVLRHKFNALSCFPSPPFLQHCAHSWPPSPWLSTFAVPFLSSDLYCPPIFTVSLPHPF